MSETDSFIDEVTEEVRRDRLFALMRRYGWIGILGVVLIVSGAAYVEWQKARASARAEAFGDAVLAAMEAPDRGAALAAISADGAQVAVLRLLVAAEATPNAETVAGLQALASDTTLPASLRALAQIKAVLMAGATMTPALRDATLAELAAPGAPFRGLAMEQQALALLADGQTEAAIALLRQILQEPELTAGLQQRVTQVIVALGADPVAN
ncbi:hypothetical protein [Phaeovulum sp.]|uniref:hypothetical protein n=1 Tax=Phaeovulum sp. TaxID=2934796 RepID=UPI00272F0A09|nr:hypothetical protein [Phaeovulum sp.]MDP1669446.1 hypothetical protein [Phaeovulum sp.]MDP2062307.1 hypothetical protein [Phaeovulum sp.]MDP3860202.1 hypothetical protein [Phaeovulum sp.]MDZ4118275.1 hypothetical protein [Phaeovulum sp.]